jgi:hypothetical protein
MQYYCYIGDRKKLKPNGWEFQKLYARNYHTYHKDGIIMYVVSKMCLELDNIKVKYQRKVIEFILKNIDKPDSFWQEKSFFFKDTMVSSWIIQDGEIMSRGQALINKRDWHLAWEKDNNIPYLEDGVFITIEWVKIIKELIELGGVELREIN